MASLRHDPSTVHVLGPLIASLSFGALLAELDWFSESEGLLRSS